MTDTFVHSSCAVVTMRAHSLEFEVVVSGEYNGRLLQHSHSDQRPLVVAQLEGGEGVLGHGLHSRHRAVRVGARGAAALGGL